MILQFNYPFTKKHLWNSGMGTCVCRRWGVWDLKWFHIYQIVFK